MAKMPSTAGPTIFYGWWVALALGIIVFLSAGVRFTIGPFLKPVSAELGLDRGTFSLVISASLFLYGAFMPPVVIDEKARPVGRAIALSARLHPVAGGR